MNTHTLAIAFMILLTIFVVDVFTHNYLSETIHTVLYSVSIPMYSAKNYLEDRFSHTIVVQNVYLFNQESNGLEVLSVDLEGLYVRNLNKKGVVINAEDGRLIGFVKKTGKVGYVVKWWESEFPVTIESTSIRSVSAVGYYSNLKIDIPDPNVRVSGKVYLSEYFEYGRLLKANNLSIGKYENDVFYPEIPQISNCVVLLEEYQDHLGTATDKGE